MPRCRCKGLADLVDAELSQRAPVDELGRTATSKHQHHVGQVHSLAPRARLHLGEEDVDQVNFAVADEQVRRLDVAVGEAGVPQSPDDAQAIVDDRLVDGDLADLLGVVEELSDDEVFPLGRDGDDPERLGTTHIGPVVHQFEGVVLLLHQPPHGVERLLILQAAVQQCATELVPAVGAQVGLRVELGEQIGVRIPLDAHPQSGSSPRIRSGRTARSPGPSRRAAVPAPGGSPRRDDPRRRGVRSGPDGR